MVLHRDTAVRGVLLGIGLATLVWAVRRDRGRYELVLAAGTRPVIQVAAPVPVAPAAAVPGEAAAD